MAYTRFDSVAVEERVQQRVYNFCMEEFKMEPVIDKPSSRNTGVVVILGGLVAFSLLICMCLAIYAYGMWKEVSVAKGNPYGNTPNPTAALTTPQPASGDRVLTDDFSNNKKNWQSRWTSGYVLVNNGQLFLESDQGNQLAFTRCDGCAPFTKHFYVQADFTTNQAIDENYGIVFNFENNFRDFYSFEINAVEGRYSLYANGTNRDDIWMMRISRQSKLIKPYPAVNRLAVSFDNDLMLLYINGSQVDSYNDPGTELKPGEFGFYVENTGYKVIVDNLYAFGN